VRGLVGDRGGALPGRGGAAPGLDLRRGATLRWILLHMLDETARHAGHLDLIRELLDGRKGYY
jgi:hypothetical protein